MPRKIIMMIIAALLMALSAGVSSADDSSLWTTTINPDALIILDLSGSMNELPQGSNATFYLQGGTGNCSNGPLYTDPGNCLTSPYFYPSGTILCTGGGPYYLTSPGGIPTGTFYIAGTGTNCTNYADAYYPNKPSDYFSYAGSNVYTSTSSCSTSYNGPYYTTSATGHTHSCSTSTYIPATSYSSTDCINGPFYRSTASGYATCNKYTSCSSPFSSNVYTATDCTNTGGPFYRSSGTGHTTTCIATDNCTPSNITSNSYLYADDTGGCTAGPFYTASGTGHATKCYLNCTCNGVNTANTQYSPDTTCAGPFYSSSGTGHTTKCSKLEIAKRSLFNLMDNNNDNTVNAADLTSLGVRFGLERYYNCGSADNDTSYATPWTRGCEQVVWPITQSDNTTTTPYANLFCNNTTCASTVTSCTTSSPQKECIAGFSPTGGTPLGDSLREGTAYLSYHKTLDSQSSCRQKSIILITDGADTYSCAGSDGNSSCGNGGTTCTSQRRSPVYYAKQAAALNFSTYVVGFGSSMPADLQNTLNWTAYYGNTRNPNATQSVVTTPPAVTVDSTNGPCSQNGSTGTDPGSYNLSGYAFLASSADELADALTSAITSIQGATYSFSSQASVAAARVTQENYLYEASFEPRPSAGANKEPFWPGHLRKYQLTDQGQLMTPSCWDAGAVLQSEDDSSRTMWTYKGASGNALTLFNTTYMTDADLGGGTSATTCGTLCNLVVGFYRGDPTYNLESWKLGDLFHTNPIIVKTPNQYFSDPRECSAASFTAFRTTDSNIRTSAKGNQIILIGANDGQLHAFHTGNGNTCSSGGDEVWSFIPPNLLQKLQVEAHNDHSNRIALTQNHDYFVDGPISAFDV